MQLPSTTGSTRVRHSWDEGCTERLCDLRRSHSTSWRPDFAWGPVTVKLLSLSSNAEPLAQNTHGLALLVVNLCLSFFVLGEEGSRCGVLGWEQRTTAVESCRMSGTSHM
jgi:hypothetical protein